MAEGFIGLHRQIREHWIYQDAEYLKVWVEMLFCARFASEPGTQMIEGQLVDIHYSEFIFGRIKWSERLGISERRLRTLMNKLQADDMIRLVKRAPKFSIYSVTNLSRYRPANDQQETHTGQGFYDDGDHQNVQQTTSKRPANDQQTTTKEQSKQRKQSNKVNKDKDINKKEYAEKVTLTDEEYQKLIVKYGAEDVARAAIQKLSNYKCSKRTKYTSDYHVLIGWVFEDFEKRKLIVLKGGQADASKPESRREPNAAEYNANYAANTKAAASGFANSGNAVQDSEREFFDQFVRRN